MFQFHRRGKVGSRPLVLLDLFRPICVTLMRPVVSTHFARRAYERPSTYTRHVLQMNASRPVHPACCPVWLCTLNNVLNSFCPTTVRVTKELTALMPSGLFPFNKRKMKYVKGSLSIKFSTFLPCLIFLPLVVRLCTGIKHFWFCCGSYV